MILQRQAKMATAEAMRKYRHSPKFLFDKGMQRLSYLTSQYAKVRDELVQLSFINPEFKFMLPPALEQRTVSPIPIRRVAAPKGMEEESAWNLECNPHRTPEQDSNLQRYKLYCEQNGLEVFPHHKEVPAISDEFRLLDAKFDRTHAEGYEGDEVWTDEDDARHLELFSKQEKQSERSPYP